MKANKGDDSILLRVSIHRMVKPPPIFIRHREVVVVKNIGFSYYLRWPDAFFYGNAIGDRCIVGVLPYIDAKVTFRSKFR